MHRSLSKSVQIEALDAIYCETTLEALTRGEKPLKKGRSLSVRSSMHPSQRSRPQLAHSSSLPSINHLHHEMGPALVR